jgi:hypothetical protein
VEVGITKGVLAFILKILKYTMEESQGKCTLTFRISKTNGITENCRAEVGLFVQIRLSQF